jgi:hypothetical protein
MSSDKKFTVTEGQVWSAIRGELENLQSEMALLNMTLKHEEASIRLDGMAKKLAQAVSKAAMPMPTVWKCRDVSCGICGKLIAVEYRNADHLVNGAMCAAIIAREMMDQHLKAGFTCDEGSTRNLKYSAWRDGDPPDVKNQNYAKE